MCVCVLRLLYTINIYIYIVYIYIPHTTSYNQSIKTHIYVHILNRAIWSDLWCSFMLHCIALTIMHFAVVVGCKKFCFCQNPSRHTLGPVLSKCPPCVLIPLYTINTHTHTHTYTHLILLYTNNLEIRTVFKWRLQIVLGHAPESYVLNTCPACDEFQNDKD